MAKSKCKFDFGTFSDGCSPTNIVGRRDLFKDKEDFLDSCNKEYDYEMEGRECSSADVNEGYIKYLPTGCDGNEAGYYLVNNSKSATKVYHIDF